MAARARARKKVAGVCLDCKAPPEPGKARCATHLEAGREYTAKYRASRREVVQELSVNPVPVALRCGSCRKREKRPGRATCVLCEERQRLRRLKRRLSSEARMVCVKCALLAVPGKRRCERHLEMQRKATAKAR